MSDPTTAPMPEPPYLAVLTVKNNPAKNQWTPTLKNGDKWLILRVSRHSAGHVNYHAKRRRDGKAATFSAAALRLNFAATKFLRSPAAQPTA